ncbi:hypothetical protein [Vibrio alginolyticus]|uniref:hypothetical protein n=1 Tax=Vibrio alginolyticus TaxID=663 RepID=UPI0006CA9788|nr:hypothetical protein [Vibrio alginolyticus]KPM98647.1 hypothetical protein AOG25_09520 [Vibrio alginolyticus]CAH7164820.1 conserved membrane hypothetical protein [Vibrio chagasii]CAH7334519.1 conserved membrane hypothetical protein [Vibrio chagasii]
MSILKRIDQLALSLLTANQRHFGRVGEPTNKTSNELVATAISARHPFRDQVFRLLIIGLVTGWIWFYFNWKLRPSSNANMAYMDIGDFFGITPGFAFGNGVILILFASHALIDLTMRGKTLSGNPYASQAKIIYRIGIIALMINLYATIAGYGPFIGSGIIGLGLTMGEMFTQTVTQLRGDNKYVIVIWVIYFMGMAYLTNKLLHYVKFNWKSMVRKVFL